MITEKTAELNLTTELVNWLYTVTGITHFAIGPSLQQEAKLGFDVAIGGGAGVLIQYKRAYVDGTGTKWTWHLNRTKGQDQHQKLQNLEASGLPVFYAFPFFSTIADIQANRRRLLLKTFWFKPSRIVPHGGPTGHHDVIYNTVTKSWTVHSDDPVPTDPPLTIYDVAKELEVVEPDGNLERLAESFNRIVLQIEGSHDIPEDSQVREGMNDLSQGVAIIGR
jgi:hypothetical protein